MSLSNSHKYRPTVFVDYTQRRDDLVHSSFHENKLGEDCSNILHIGFPSFLSHTPDFTYSCFDCSMYLFLLRSSQVFQGRFLLMNRKSPLLLTLLKGKLNSIFYISIILHLAFPIDKALTLIVQALFFLHKDVQC